MTNIGRYRKIMQGGGKPINIGFGLVSGVV